MARIGQDLSGVEARSDIEPIPAGTYLAQIIESDVVPAKTGTGERLNMTFEVLEGPYANRKVWDGQNIVNSNPTAQTIAQQFLKSVCDAIGHHGNVDDSEELHHQPMLIRVAIEQKDPNYAARNVVKAVKPANAAPPAGKPAASANPSTARTTHNAGTAATKPTTGEKPWQRGRAA